MAWTCWLRRAIERNRRDRAISRFRQRHGGGTIEVLHGSTCMITIEDIPPVALTEHSLTRPIQARLTVDQAMRLDAYARRERTTISGAVQRLVARLPPPAGDEPPRIRRRSAAAYHPG